MNTYRVEVERGERHWLVHVPEVDRWTQARNLHEVEPMARDLVAIMREVDPESFALDVHVSLPELVREHIEQAERLRERSARDQAEAARQSREAARALRDAGVTVRDIGTAMGVSFQRAHQLSRAS